MPSKNKTNAETTDRELLEAITRELRAIYSDVIRQPPPPNLPLPLCVWKAGLPSSQSPTSALKTRASPT